MSTYSVNQEFKDLLWGTPSPIIARLNSGIAMIKIKGACSLIVGDADLLQEKLPDVREMTSHVRSTLVMAATDAVAEMGQRVSSVEQLASFTPEFTNLMKIKAMDGLAGYGLNLKELQIHGIEDGGPAPF